MGPNAPRGAAAPVPEQSQICLLPCEDTELTAAIRMPLHCSIHRLQYRQQDARCWIGQRQPYLDLSRHCKPFMPDPPSTPIRPSVPPTPRAGETVRRNSHAWIPSWPSRRYRSLRVRLAGIAR